MAIEQVKEKDSNGLIPPYGGKLIDLIIKNEELKSELISNTSYQIECSDRNAWDVELLMVGAFSPLEGFMDQNDYKSVIKKIEFPMAFYLVYR